MALVNCSSAHDRFFGIQETISQTLRIPIPPLAPNPAAIIQNVPEIYCRYKIICPTIALPSKKHYRNDVNLTKEGLWI